MNWLKQVFRRRTAKELAAIELADAQASLLEARTGVEWATALVTYNEARVTRLAAYLKESL